MSYLGSSIQKNTHFAHSKQKYPNLKTNINRRFKNSLIQRSLTRAVLMHGRRNSRYHFAHGMQRPHITYVGIRTRYTGSWFWLQCALSLHSASRVCFLGLIGKSLFTVKSEPMKHTQRPSISLVSETLMFSWMSSPLISDGPLCLARVCHVSASPGRSGWGTGVWVGWKGWSAVRSFWQQAVQGVCWSLDIRLLV